MLAEYNGAQLLREQAARGRGGADLEETALFTHNWGTSRKYTQGSRRVQSQQGLDFYAVWG